MRLKIGEIMSLATFVLGCLAYMKVKKKYVAFLLWGVCLISLILVVTSENQDNTSANNTTVTATSSGKGSSAQAAGHDINNGVPASTVQQILNLKDVELSERMLADYPHGCIIIGLKNGKVIYDPRLKDISVTGDWDNAKLVVDTNSQKATLYISDMWIGGIEIDHNSFSFDYSKTEPKRVTGISFSGVQIYSQVLDKDKGIFLIGFK